MKLVLVEAGILQTGFSPAFSHRIYLSYLDIYRKPGRLFFLGLVFLSSNCFRLPRAWVSHLSHWSHLSHSWLPRLRAQGPSQALVVPSPLTIDAQARRSSRTLCRAPNGAHAARWAVLWAKDQRPKTRDQRPKTAIPLLGLADYWRLKVFQCEANEMGNRKRSGSRRRVEEVCASPDGDEDRCRRSLRMSGSRWS